MAETPKIYETVINVMEEIGAIGKDKRSQQGFNYRGIDDVMNALNPAFIKHKLFVVPEVLDQKREDRTTAKGSGLIYSVCRIKYTFYAADGSHVEVVMVGEAMDSGDKATNKAMAIAFKYACFQLFCIPTEEMVDPDSEGYNVAPAGKKNTAKEETKKPATTAKSSDATGKASAKRAEPADKTQASGPDKVTQKDIEHIQGLIDKYSSKGLKMEKILKMYQIKAIADMSADQYKDCVNKLKLYEEKEPAHE